MNKAKRVSSGKKTEKGKKRSAEATHNSGKNIKAESTLIKNSIELQKVMVNLSAKFEALSSQISRLLDLFEISAKTLAKKEISSEGLEAKKIMEKLENISQQAGLIGKGLALIHEVRAEDEPIGHGLTISQPLNQRKDKIQFPSSASSPVQSNLPVGRAPLQKMTMEFGEFEKSKEPGEFVDESGIRFAEKSGIGKGRRLGKDTNAGTNI